MRRHGLPLSSVTHLGLQIQLQVFEQTRSPLDYRAITPGDNADRVSPDLIASPAKKWKVGIREPEVRDPRSNQGKWKLSLGASHLSFFSPDSPSFLLSPFLRDVHLQRLTKSLTHTS